MKKLSIILLALILCLNLGACGNSLEKDLQEARKRTEMFEKDLNDINKRINETSKYFK